MKTVRHRLKKLENKAGINIEPMIVIVKIYGNGKHYGDKSLECAVFEKDEVSLCPEYHKINQDPKNPVIVFSPPCGSCKEPVKK